MPPGHHFHVVLQYESAFRTSELREAEQRTRAQQFGPVMVRFHLPDQSIIQATFSASDTISSLQSTVMSCLAPGLAPAPPNPAGMPPQHSGSKQTQGLRTSSSKGFYLYTTPPKVVLNDLGSTLYQAGLVPAAHVYVHIDEQAGEAGSW